MGNISIEVCNDCNIYLESNNLSHVDEKQAKRILKGEKRLLKKCDYISFLGDEIEDDVYCDCCNQTSFGAITYQLEKL